MKKIMTTIAVLMLAVCSGDVRADVFDEIRAEQQKALKAAQAEGAKVLDGLMAVIKKDDSLKKAQKTAIEKLIDGTRDGELPDMAEAISTSLTLMDKNFGGAMIAWGQENNAAAVKKLRASVKSKNRFVAAQSKYFLGRAYMQQEIYEDALLPLTDLLENDTDYTLYTADAMFLKGVCLAKLLKRDEAIKTLEAFLEKYRWTASERMATGAEVLLSELRWIKDGTLQDVQERMEYSSRRLKLEETGKPTQTEQKKVVEILEKLIEEAEEKEKQGQGSGSGSGSGQGQGGNPNGNQQSSGPAENSSAGGGPGRTGDLNDVKKNLAEPWGRDREKERTRVMKSLEEQFPERYRELLEQYYKGLQGDGENIP